MAVHVAVFYILINYALFGNREVIGDITKLVPINTSVANQLKFASSRQVKAHKTIRPTFLITTNDNKTSLAKRFNSNPVSLALHKQNNNTTNTTVDINGTIEHQQALSDNHITSNQQEILLQNINEIIQSMNRETRKY